MADPTLQELHSLFVIVLIDRALLPGDKESSQRQVLAQNGPSHFVPREVEEAVNAGTTAGSINRSMTAFTRLPFAKKMLNYPIGGGL